MSFLHFLEDIRNPVLDSFFSFITTLGSESIFIIVAAVIFWCVDKKRGYYLFFVGFSGLALNQLLKIIFRIPRPWIRDADLSPLASALPDAGGYSFPSGHTQTSVGLYGGLAFTEIKKPFNIIWFSFCVLIPFSRMYLGVHTPLDVLLSVILALMLLLFFKLFLKNNNFRFASGSLLIITVSYLVYCVYLMLENSEDPNNLVSFENALALFSASLSLALSAFIERKFIRFETNAAMPIQAIKVLVGLAIVFIIKYGFSEPFLSSVGYFIMIVFICVIWPLIFEKFNKKA